MMCEKCGINPAAVTLTRVINGKKSVVKLCASCAQENNIYKDLNMDLGFSSLFSSFFSDNEQEDSRTVSCPVCSMTKPEFLKHGKPGCANCYSVFESSMTPLLKKIHSTTNHTGKVYGTSGGKSENKIDLLKHQLKEAIEKEEYEKAARLRDEIKEMEGRK
ncbi:MAG: UvrB/UvrC motif-containing protein [Clostridia bacterium]|nr:UvrB/UvrC motif-containing protein [Clostridia bacterium]